MTLKKKKPTLIKPQIKAAYRKQLVLVKWKNKTEESWLHPRTKYLDT